MAYLASLKRILGAIALVLVLGLGMLLAIANDTPVAVDLLFVQLPEIRVSVWLLSAFVLGGFCGLLAASGSMLAGAAKTARLRRQLSKAEQELNKLRQSPYNS